MKRAIKCILNNKNPTSIDKDGAVIINVFGKKFSIKVDNNNVKSALQSPYQSPLTPDYGLMVSILV